MRTAPDNLVARPLEIEHLHVIGSRKEVVQAFDESIGKVLVEEEPQAVARRARTGSEA